MLAAPWVASCRSAYWPRCNRLSAPPPPCTSTRINTHNCLSPPHFAPSLIPVQLLTLSLTWQLKQVSETIPTKKRRAHRILHPADAGDDANVTLRGNHWDSPSAGNPVDDSVVDDQSEAVEATTEEERHARKKEVAKAFARQATTLPKLRCENIRSETVKTFQDIEGQLVDVLPELWFRALTLSLPVGVVTSNY